MVNEKLTITKIDTYDPNDPETELVLLYNGKFYQLEPETPD